MKIRLQQRSPKKGYVCRCMALNLLHVLVETVVEGRTQKKRKIQGMIFFPRTAFIQCSLCIAGKDRTQQKASKRGKGI